MLNSPMNNHMERLGNSLRTIAKFMRASNRTSWCDWQDLMITAGSMTTCQETLDKDMEKVYDIHISDSARRDLRGISVILEDGTIGTIVGFQVKLEKLNNNNKEDSK